MGCLDALAYSKKARLEGEAPLSGHKASAVSVWCMNIYFACGVVGGLQYREKIWVAPIDLKPPFNGGFGFFYAKGSLNSN